MLTKTIRLQIIKPTDATWDEFGQLLRDLQRESSEMCNYVIQFCYENENMKKRYYKDNGIYPNDSELYGMSFDSWVYSKLRNEYPEISSNIISQTKRYVIKRWKTDRKAIAKHEISIPSFKKNTPISIRNDAYKIINKENEWTIAANLKMSDQGYQHKYSWLIHSGDNSSRAILHRLITGEYKKGVMQLTQDNKKKWYCLITYSFEALPVILDDERIMGVDLGIVNAVYWAFNDSPKRGKILGGEIDQFRKQIQNRRKELQQAIKWAGDGRKGHGVKRALAPIEKLQEKERNARNTINHKYAKAIVEAAYKHGCAIIQLEDLSGISNGERFLQNWTYFDLQEKIKYKAAEKGIQVIKVSPQYTSQRCSQCGYIDSGSRTSQANFNCVSCGYEALADYNAARNIATQDIEKLIQQQIELQKI